LLDPQRLFFAWFCNPFGLSGLDPPSAGHKLSISLASVGTGNGRVVQAR
jgi:hypothetical protein